MIKAEKISAATSEFKFSYLIADYSPSIKVLYNKEKPEIVEIRFTNYTHNIMEISVESEFNILSEKNFKLISLDMKELSKDPNLKNQFLVVIENPEKKMEIPLSLKIENKFESYNAPVTFDIKVLLEDVNKK